MTPIFIGSEIYRGSSYGAKHPLSIPRVPTVIDLCRTMGWLPDASYRRSPRAKKAALTRFHTEDYVDAVIAAEAAQMVSEIQLKRHGLGTLSNPVFPEMFRRPATAAGGSLLASELLREGGIVYNPGGGTHHGLPDRAAGFCYFNDPALALLAFRAQGLARILYLDIDAHHCDGVERATCGAEDIRTMSVHEAGRWPRTGGFDETNQGSAINLPVPAGLNDTEFAMLRDHVILPAIERFSPDVIVLQAGADALLEDPLSRLALSNAAYRALVLAIKPMAPRLLVLGGGGYNPWSVGRCWSVIWASLAEQDIPERIGAAAQSILSDLTWPRRPQEPQEALLRTLLDTPRTGPVRPEIADLVRAAQARIQRFAGR